MFNIKTLSSVLWPLIAVLLYVFFAYNDFWYGYALVGVLALAYVYFFKFNIFFFLTVLCVPFSFNLEDVSGLGMYLPTEPMLVLLMFAFLFKQFYPSAVSPLKFKSRHFLTTIILLHLVWIAITTIYSEMPVVSLKFLIARLWFVLPMYFLSMGFFQRFKSMKTFVYCFVGSMSVVIFITLIKHQAHGFSEETGHWISSPFFKDHTSYGCAIALCFPFITFFFFKKNQTNISKILSFLWLLIVVLGLYFSYTRAAWLSVAVAFAVWGIMKLKIKFKYLLYVFVFLTTILFANWSNIEHFLNKNDNEHTSENFSDRIKSMTNISSDASNLERLNRWDCAVEMFLKRPFLGWGPGTYSFQYAPFQKPQNITVISTNFGIAGNAHSEYLGPLSEQGLLGFIWVALLFGGVLYYGINLYNRLPNSEAKTFVMSIVLSLTTYIVHGILNNYLDTDKLSVPFWGFVAMIVVLDKMHPKNQAKLD